ncbi:hypothetical protein ElyMa_006270000 [Elysia marginata]|uniref:Serine protease n=1 Tax=Elysia marginata TaxID=1093978 RepID=A0AAV4HDW8_9GAST|nr:hypothetical protein ElyMa_006270000 [Elysia marginata]
MEKNDRAVVERKRKDQGLHECEVYGGGSDDLEGNQSWQACEKNPGHACFIPYTDFRREHLPEAWQTQDVWSQVVDVAERTVKLRVGYTSMERPEGYAFYNHRGTSLVHTGSGWIEHVISRTDVPCPCTDCDRSVSPHTGFWFEVNVITACHVVYNAEEAKSTRVDVHYDAKTSRREGTMQTIWAYDVIKSGAVEDACVLVCAAHELYNVQLSFPLKVRVLPTPDLKVTRDDPCIVISHPHGSPKQVTVGEVRQADRSHPEGLITYSADTCPGTSGAPVLCLYSEGSRTVTQSSVHSKGGVADGHNQGSCVFIKLE